jgi:type I restriction enzyme, S subunit
MEIQLPPMAIQRRIIDILSAYDDLIENNTRRIAILEEMARAIYREWFVDFRYPGHEQAEMLESELGPVPAGWGVVPLAQIDNHLRDNIQPGDHPDEVFAHFSIPAYDAGRQSALEKGATISSTKHLVQAGTVLLSKSTHPSRLDAIPSGGV